MAAAWWSVRIRADAENGKAKSIDEYLDELLPEHELLEKSSARLAAFFDAQIAEGQATEQ